MIRERTGHKSSALFSYQKPSDQQTSKVSKLLGPCSSTITAATTSKDGESAQPAVCASHSPAVSPNDQILGSAMFLDCNVNISISKKE